MAEDKATRKELEDKKVKVQSARKGANAPGASEREKSDLKMAEQALQAEQQKAQRNSTAKPGGRDEPKNLEKKMDQKLDDALKDSFPGSDPVSFVEASPVKKEDHDLTSVKVNDK